MLWSADCGTGGKATVLLLSGCSGAMIRVFPITIYTGPVICSGIFTINPERLSGSWAYAGQDKRSQALSPENVRKIFLARTAMSSDTMPENKITIYSAPAQISNRMP